MDKKQIILFLFSFCFFSCVNENKESGLSLELIDKSVNTFTNDGKEIINVSYKIENNSNLIYLIRKSINFDSSSKRVLNSNKLQFSFFDSNNKELDYKIKPLFINDVLHKYLLDKENFEVNVLKKWNNQKFRDIENDIIIIHPKETIFFKEIINLNKPSLFFLNRDNYVELERNKDYYLRMKIISDSVDVFQNLPRHIQRTIKTNNVKMYHGIIDSKNKVSIKVLD